MSFQPATCKIYLPCGGSPFLSVEIFFYETLIYMGNLLTKCEVKMAGYILAKFFFCVFMDQDGIKVRDGAEVREGVEVHLNTKEQGI